MCNQSCVNYLWNNITVSQWVYVSFPVPISVSYYQTTPEGCFKWLKMESKWIFRGRKFLYGDYIMIHGVRTQLMILREGRGSHKKIGCGGADSYTNKKGNRE